MSELINFPNSPEEAIDSNEVIKEAFKNFDFNNFFEEMENVSENDLNNIEGMEEIAVLLSMKDEDFALIAPFYLMEMEKALNNANDKLALIESIHLAGTSTDEITKIYVELLDKVDIELADVLSVPKCNFLKRMCAIVINAINEAEGGAKKIIQIPMEKISDKVKTPAYARIGDAGMDVYALEDITVAPGETKLIPLGFKVALPIGYELQVRPKSGRALKTKLRVANTPGTIDSGYRDEVCVIIENIEPPFKDIDYIFDDNGNIIIKSILHGASYTIGEGEKFAQLVLSEVPTATFFDVDSVAAYEGDRGGGFGSSGLM